MRLRNKVVALTAVVAVAAAGWVGTGGVGAQASSPRGSDEPYGEGTTTYHRPDIVRPTSDQSSPSAPIVAGDTWVSQGDLTFHPLVPCRIVDTRVLGAKLPDGGVYSFDAFPFPTDNFAYQGGFGGGDCGVPFTALAVEINVTTVDSNVLGHLRLYPFSTALPNASIVNYSTQQNIANAVTIRRCAGPEGELCSHDFSIYAFTSAHIIVDVLGYYEPPLSAQVDPNGSVFGASLGLFGAVYNGAGSYGLAFDRDVSDCVLSATIGWGDATGPFAGPGFIEVRDDPDFSIAIEIQTWDAAGVAADMPFQVVVHC